MNGRRGFFGQVFGGLLVAYGIAPSKPLSIYRGTLHTGGSLRDLVEYGEHFSAYEYSNVFNRILRDSYIDQARLSAVDRVTRF